MTVDDGFEKQLAVCLRDLNGLARKLTGYPEDEADELVQATLERALVKRHTYDPQRSMRPWLFQIMRNLRAYGRRRRQRERVLAFSEVVNSDEVGPEALEMPQLPSQEDRIALNGVVSEVATLNTDQQAVVWLVAVQGCSCEEVARMNGVAVNTVKTRLNRARTTLRRRVADERAA